MPAGSALPLWPPGRKSGSQRISHCLRASLTQPLFTRRALSRRPVGRFPLAGTLLDEGGLIMLWSLLREPGPGQLGLAAPPLPKCQSAEARHFVADRNRSVVGVATSANFDYGSIFQH